jgi:hypothetical protein
MWVDHNPQHSAIVPDACGKCGKPINRHRVEHAMTGAPGARSCSTCGLPAANHRDRERNPEYLRRKASKAEKRKRPDRERDRPEKDVQYIGVDGEGIGRQEHKYVLLSAAVEVSEGHERTWWVEDYDGLSTADCLDFLLWLPAKAKVFGYSFNYDLTKILADLPDDKLYILFRPELRQRAGKEAVKGPIPVKWGGYRLNLQGTKFTVSKGGRHRVVWDVFKFYGCKFVQALKDWKVGGKDDLVEMGAMKDQRATLDLLAQTYAGRMRIRRYCLDECRKMAELAHKLVASHEAVGLKLKSYFGAGSSGAAMLNAMGIKERMAPFPKYLKEAVAAAFFGGRFENSMIGAVNQPVWNRDLSSAYPYHIMFLPCLQHGKWRKVTNRNEIEGSTCALVRYALGDSKIRGVSKDWGPLPFRDNDGNICYPIESGGGWVWGDEYRQAERLWPHVHFLEAWVYHTNCDCKPFEKIAEYYCERCRIGKEGPGIVIKLGCNSCYGKIAQSVGNGLFNSWIWAGLITSGCRAQVLEMLGRHRDWANLLMIATDGIYTLEDFPAAEPRDTGSGHPIKDESTGKTACKPLGGWETKRIDKGVFVARPGIYFPLNPTADELKDVRGRGVGKGVVYENWQKIVWAWSEHGATRTIQVANVSRFCGAKTSISRSGKPGQYTYRRADGAEGAPAYGEWISRNVDMSFNPMPKRGSVDVYGKLALRRMPRDMTSVPYKRAMRSADAMLMKAAEQEALEQPDADLADYEGQDAYE